MTKFVYRRSKNTQMTIRITDDEKIMKDELIENGVNVSQIFRDALKSSYNEFINKPQEWD